MAYPIQNSEITGAVRTTLPNLLGIGAAKAGTTWFADVLSRHPDVFVPPQKELNCLHYDDLDDRLEEYAEYFRGAEEARVRCDFSVRYLSSKNAPFAAARLAPDAKILAILRNPIEQVQSNYWHLVRQNFNQASPLKRMPDLFEALEMFPELLLEPALYAKHLTRWRSVFDPKYLFVIEYRDATARLPETLNRLWDFLMIEPPPGEIAASSGATREGRLGVRPREGILGRMYPTLYTGLARGPYQWLKRRVGVRQAENLKRLLRLRQSAEAIFFKAGYPKLDATGQRRLFDIFSDDIAQLCEMDLIDLSAWRPS